MESPEAAAEEYRMTLAELKSNNKTQINLLTILADDYKSAAPQIVDVIEKHLTTVPPDQKLAVMYVCDSIMKNVKAPNDYNMLFARKIVSMFDHVFRQGDEKMRSALYKLRVTWASTQVFIPSKLYSLDMRINAMDSAWPISNPRTGRALRDDPNVAPPATPSTPSTPSTSTAGPSGSASRVYVNPRFIDGNNAPSTSSPKSSVATAGPIKKIEKTKAPSKSTSDANQKAAKKETKVDPLRFSDKLLPSGGAAGKSSSSTSTTSTGSKRKAVPAEHVSAPTRKTKPSSAATLDEDLRQINVSAQKPLSRPLPAGHDTDFRNAAPVSVPRSLKPTSVVGSHAFAAPVRVPPQQPPPPPVQPFAAGAGVWTAPPSVTAPGFHHNSPPQDPAPPMGPPMGPPMRHAPTGPPPSKNVYASEQTKLDVPANNRIFVDGKAYEVMFVDDTAVIERAGAPHRIYFAGPPRNLIIDGVAHMVPFDTPTPVEILGSQHIVKFGAPSRELYIGGHPFKGQFGGPPIVATINGRRHEIRLTGSAPEVRIEPEPAYHLTRFLHKMREEKKIEITAEKPKEDWFAYLKNLRKSGILPPVKSTSPPPQPQGAKRGGRQGRGGHHQNSHLHPTKNQQNSPNQWSKPTMMDTPSPTGVEKRQAPPAALADFNIRLLQIRYDSVVEQLVSEREDACKFCGMRLEDAKSEAAKRHMDWHIQQQLTDKNMSSTTYRLWYPLAADWLTDRASDQPNAKKDQEEEGPLPGVASTGVKAKECAVCQEKFDEYFDDDEETWRLRDTVSVNGKIVHAACSADASLALDTPNSSFAENPFIIEIKQEDDVDHKDFKPIISFGQSASQLSGR
uniref:CID domain-containing protein n=1 Tax=Caenorhabditis japonica TaxID=281687 RepID=A0A8R1DYS7_CAEJA